MNYWAFIFCLLLQYTAQAATQSDVEECMESLVKIAGANHPKISQFEDIIKNGPFKKVIRPASNELLKEELPISSSSIYKILEVIDHIDETLVRDNPGVVRPEGLVLEVRNAINNPRFQLVGEQILNTGRFRYYGSSDEPFYLIPRYTNNITAHEYGHAILDATLSQQFDLIENRTLNGTFQEMEKKVKHLQKQFDHTLRTLNQRYNQYGPRRQKYIYDKNNNIVVSQFFSREEDLFYKELRETLDGENGLKEIELLEQELILHQKVLDQNKMALKEIENLVEKSEIIKLLKKNSQFYIGMHELFADLTAVLFDNNNPKAISDGFSTRLDSTFENTSTKYTARDFSWKGNEISVAKKIRPSDLSINHKYYAPTRYYLWDSFLSKPEFQKTKMKKLLYRSVAKAISDELRNIFESPRLRESSLVSNESLIKRIDDIVTESMAKFPSNVEVN